MRHSTSIKLSLALSGAIFLTGCALSPGSNFVTDVESEPLYDLVDIKPITLEMINAQRPHSEAESAMRQAGLAPQETAQPTAVGYQYHTGYQYRIGKGDVLSIIVYEHPELTIPSGAERSAAEAGNTVHDDGTIYYPFVGRIKVEGSTVREVRDQIARRLSSYITEPQVEVKVAAFNSQHVLISGEVAAPSRQPITNVPMTVLDAITMTGGPTRQANWHGVQLLRNGEIHRLSLYAMLNDGRLTDDLLLRDGDVLYVPDLGAQQVFVMGAVGRPQALSMGRSPLSLTEALSRSGSINETLADASGIFVFRRQPRPSDKLATVYQLDARNAAAMLLGTEFMLEPTDVVYVTTAPIARWNRVISLMLPSIRLPGTTAGSVSDAQDL